ncbi:MAG: efflux RND transporter periplasmic adaptor subunit [Carboxylicivirga sp.]|jgi:membrane fusion protein (multidrug efflux system)|nr:efflux RND transporter periplasmic adaptor subunit [Carboxylicivirga sp.]
MKQRFRLSLAFIAIVLSACQGGNWNQQAQGDPKLPVIKIETADLSSFTSYPTSLEGIQSIDIRAKVDGYINKVNVDEGQKVKAGTVLFELETFSLSQSALAAKSAIKSAELEVKKLKPLVEQKVVSAIQLQTAEANLQQAKANYRSILANIEYTKIKSPVDGVVGTINFREGALVSPATQDALTQVSNTNDVYAFFSINEKDLLRLMKDTEGKSMNEKISALPEVELVLADGSVYPHKGIIGTIAGQVEKTTGGVQFRATFPNPDQLLRNGNSGQIRLPESYTNNIAIPQQCSFEIQGIPHVYLLNDDNTLQSKAIDVEAKVGRYLVIRDGLTKGQTILAKGLNKVFPGSKIIPEKTSMKELIESFQPVFK